MMWVRLALDAHSWYAPEHMSHLWSIETSVGRYQFEVSFRLNVGISEVIRCIAPLMLYYNTAPYSDIHCMSG